MDRIPALTVEQLRADVAAGTVDTVLVVITDMQGRLQGKRLHAPVLPRQVLGHGTEGCNYLLGRRRRHEHGRRLRDDARGGRGYGDIAMVPDLDTLRLLPWQPGTAIVQCDLQWQDGSDVVRVAAADPRSAARHGSPAAGMDAFAGTELEFIVFQDTYEEALDDGLPRPHAGQPVQRRLLDPRHRPGRAAAARHPQRHVRRGAGRRGRQGRVQPRPARDRLPVRRGAGHRRQPRRLQDRRQGDRRPARRSADLHGQVQRARGQLLPHPPLAARRRRRDRASGTTPTTRPAGRRSYDSFVAGVLAHDARASRCSTRPTSTPTSVSPTARSRRPRSPGARTTAPAPSGWSATARARGWRTGCPAAT